MGLRADRLPRVATGPIAMIGEPVLVRQFAEPVIDVDGPVRTYRSSEWAERAFFETCGSSLWYEAQEDGARQLSAGLFDDAAGTVLSLEYHVDRKPRGYTLAGDHQRLTGAECLAMFAPDK